MSFNIWDRASNISHVFSFFIRLLYLILFPELLTSTSFIEKGLCSILLFLPMYNLSLSTKTKLYNRSVQIQEKCFLGVCSSLYATHTEKKQRKKESQKTSMTVFSLDSLVSGVLSQFEMQSWGVFFCHKRHNKWLFCSLLSISCRLPIDTSERCVCGCLRCSFGALTLNCCLYNYYWNQWPGSSSI